MSPINGCFPVDITVLPVGITVLTFTDKRYLRLFFVIFVVIILIMVKVSLSLGLINMPLRRTAQRIAQPFSVLPLD
jgi:hypothetical protein